MNDKITVTLYGMDVEVEYTHTPGNQGNMNGHPDTWKPSEGCQLEIHAAWFVDDKGYSAVKLSNELLEDWRESLEDLVLESLGAE